MLANSTTNFNMEQPEYEPAFGVLYVIKHYSIFGARL